MLRCVVAGARPTVCPAVTQSATQPQANPDNSVSLVNHVSIHLSFAIDLIFCNEDMESLGVNKKKLKIAHNIPVRFCSKDSDAYGVGIVHCCASSSTMLVAPG